MGFLEIGQPLTWIETNEIKESIKTDGLDQLLHIYRLNRTRSDRDLKWGEELEFTLIHFDHEKKVAQVCIDGPQILEQLEAKEHSDSWDSDQVLGKAAAMVSGGKLPVLRGTVWHPEFGRHMIEATPNPPYEMSVDSLLDIEDSMVSRRFKVQSCLPEDVYVSSLTAFPRLGLENFMWSQEDSGRDKVDPERNRSCGMSIFIPDAMICPHPRFPTLVRNITTRRKCKSVMTIPVFKDSHTEQSPVWEKSLDPSTFVSPATSRLAIAARSTATENPVKGHIFMDHFGFGMGMSCLQMTFGTSNLTEARYLYDQLSVLAPIFLAVSAATPALRGFLSDYDARWKVLEQGCDDRTAAELDGGLKRTRYGPVSLYLSNDPYLERHEKYLNDVEVPLHEPGYQQLVDGGMDSTLARHFASLWIRDPLVVFGEKIHLNNAVAVDHFENIQSTNWNSVRFKPPPPSADGKTLPTIGWRVELRTCDLQLTDFENAVLAAFSNLLAMAIMKLKWNFYIPISQTHANMDAAHKRDAVKSATFWFPTSIELEEESTDSTESSEGDCTSPLPSAQMTLREIFLGSKRNHFEGLIPLLDKFVSSEWRAGKCSRDAVERYRIYADYMRLRVLGQVPSNANMMRHFVQSHPDYEADSIVSDPINYDLCKMSVLTGFALKQETAKTTLPPRPLLSTLANVPILRQLLRLPNETTTVVASLDRIRSSSFRTDEDSFDSWEAQPPWRSLKTAEPEECAKH